MKNIFKNLVLFFLFIQSFQTYAQTDKTSILLHQEKFEVFDITKNLPAVSSNSAKTIQKAISGSNKEEAFITQPDNGFSGKLLTDVGPIFTPTEEPVPAITGELTVGAAGGLNYNIPIDVPKGVNNFQPNLSLVYNSDAGMGMAGYGWSVSGLSGITRGGKSIAVDGINQGVQYDETDAWYLDGQRLVKESEGVYRTVVFSQIKVLKTNEGFTVLYPDGKKAEYVDFYKDYYQNYKNDNFVISKITDVFGNFINYLYYFPQTSWEENEFNNSVFSTTINYGSSSKTVGSIEFTYKLKAFQDQLFRKGNNYLSNKIYTNISIKNADNTTYRVYDFFYNYNTKGKERLRKVTVKNAAGQLLKPLNFTYSNDVLNANSSLTTTSNQGVSDSATAIGQSVSGDFFGDGKISLIYAVEENKVWRLYNDRKGYMNVNINKKDKLFAGKILDINGKITERDHLITIREVGSGEIVQNGLKYSTANMNINYYDIVDESSTKSQNFTLLKSTKRIRYNYNYQIRFNTNPFISDKCKALFDVKLVTEELNYKVLPGDFDNDGLIDFTIINNEYGGYPQNISLDIKLWTENTVDMPGGGWYDCDKPTFSGLTNYLSNTVEFNPYNRSNRNQILTIFGHKESEQISNIKEYQGINTSGEEGLNYSVNSEFYPIEQDGDGTPEIMVVNREAKTYDILKFTTKTEPVQEGLPQYKSLEGLKKTHSNKPLVNFGPDTPLIFGDYNGDGLTDFMTPNKIWDISQTGLGDFNLELNSGLTKHIWSVYTGIGGSLNGSPFITYSEDYTKNKLAYCKTNIKENITQTSGGSWWSSWTETIYGDTDFASCGIFPTDLNNDGKTDLISYVKSGKVNLVKDRDRTINASVVYRAGEENNINYFNFHESSNASIVAFATDEKNAINHAELNISPFTPMYLVPKSNGLSSYQTALILYDLHQKKTSEVKITSPLNFSENALTQINNNSGVMQEIKYSTANTGGENGVKNPFYKYNEAEPDSNLKYPVYIHKKIPSKTLVAQVNTAFNGNNLTKEYRYQNAVQDVYNGGFLGFQKVSVSNLFEANLGSTGYYSPKDPSKELLWNTSYNNPLNENQTYKTTFGTLDKILKESTILSTKVAKGLKRFVWQENSTTAKDYLTNVTVTTNNTYDPITGYLTASTQNFGTATKTSNFSYLPNWEANGRLFAGRMAKTEESTTAYGNTFATKEEFTYDTNTGASLSKTVYGNNTTGKKETYLYDAYGNVTQTTATVGSNTLTTKVEFDESKRFITKTTTPEGKINTRKVNVLGQTTEETNYLNQTTKHTYDAWGNPTTSTDHLGIVSSISRKMIEKGNYQVQSTVTGRPSVIKVFDLLDREIQTKTQALNNKWVISAMEYDVFGKKTKAYEPYFEGENATLFTTTSYDYLDRPEKVVHHSGKTITTCYDGLKVTVDDGTKKTTKTLDALGNTVYHKDPGGEINYTYFANGNLKEANYEGIKIQIEQDGWGNKTKLTDTSAGMYTYTYDDWGRTLTETTPKGSTTYTYDQYGKTLIEKTVGDQTDILLSYAYDANSLLPTKIVGNSNGKTHTYETMYDEKYRIKGKKETTPDYNYQTVITYDELNRVSNNQASFKPNHLSKTITTATQNLYDKNGLQVALKDTKTNKTIWERKTENAKGQSLQTNLGNGIVINNSYDAVGFPTSIKHAGSGVTAIEMVYAFDTKRGILQSREFKHLGKKETFTHDELDRLTEETLNNAVKNAYTYDHRGRMTYNTALGKYGYTEEKFQLNSVQLNQKGRQETNNQGPNYKITYNSYKAPTEIYIAKPLFWRLRQTQEGDRISFEYNPLKERSKITYGNTIAQLRTKTKIYTADKAFEMKRDNKLISPDTEIVAYIDGDPYTASYIQKTSFKNRWFPAQEENLYLHRDYQQTILAISNAQGKLVEQRRFDAWGNIEEVRHYDRLLFFRKYTTNKALETLDRGYTGHEHLQSVGLIHMNGRVYDPLLRRFLGPDNFVQDPFNTQNFNRYGYVLNNPLLYTDPSGEFLTWSFGPGGFSIGLNFSPIGIPFGFGINVGWEGGFSLGAYGEAGARFGGTGFGFNASMSVSVGYNFGSGTASLGIGESFSASLGPLFTGVNMGITFLSNGQIINSWGASVGIGLYNNEKGSLGISAGYGSGGFSYGLNGSYNNTRAREMAKQYQQNKQAQLAEEMNQKLYELLEKSGVSFASTNNGDWSDKISKTLDGLGFSAGVQESILKLGRLTQKGDMKGLLHYMKSTKGMDRFLGLSGKGLGISSVGLSFVNYIDNPTTPNLVSFFLNTASLTGGPISSTIYSAYSLSPASNYVNGIIGGYINQGCNCNAGYNVYQGIYNLANPKVQHNEIFKGQW